MIRLARPSPSRRPGTPVRWDPVLALACAALALWTHRRALGVYFHPDDLISMEWTRGILPSPDFGLWRLFPGQGYFAPALGWFCPHPFPFHLLKIILCTTSVILLSFLPRRLGRPPPAAPPHAWQFRSSRP